MSCSSCNSQIINCNCKKDKPSCEQRLTVDWVPNTACTFGATLDGVTDTLELRPGILACESKTHMTLNGQTGCIEYRNESYVGADGQDQSLLETICVPDLLGHGNLEDLGNVEDETPRQCSMLVYSKGGECSDCGPGCTSASDLWKHWYATDNLVDSMAYVGGYTEDGCPVALDKPTEASCSINQLLHDGEKAFWGSMDYPDIGDVFPGDPTQEWRFPFITLDDNGCPAKGWLNFEILKPLVSGLNVAWTTGRVVQGGYSGEYWWVDGNQNTGTGTFKGPEVGAFPSGTTSMEFSYLDSSTASNANASRVRIQFRYNWDMVFNGSTNKFSIRGTVTFTNIFREAFAGNPGTLTYNWTLRFGGQTLYSTPWTFNQFGQLPGFVQKSAPFFLELTAGQETGDDGLIRIVNSATGLPTDEFVAGIAFKNTIGA